MHQPPHPGEVLNELCLKPLGLIAFKTTAESWLNQQVQYDLWHAEKTRKRLRVTRLTAA